mmetsp:Transcript_28762/g.43906  ORF Transcript_28762/g.43906 Transcript_28762/m.43906 type:complete len:651 (+) Transcript_28762:115-2067(+)
MRTNDRDQYSTASESSSLSSFSGGSTSTWSIPRIRRAATTSYRASEGPRRLGSSFRVSLRPSRHRDPSPSSKHLDTADFRSFWRKTIYPLLGLVSIGLSFHLLSKSLSSSLAYGGSTALESSTEKSSNGSPLFYEDIFKGKQHFLEEETVAALRGSMLEITVEGENSSSYFFDPENATDSGITTKPANVTETKQITQVRRSDWGPALRESSGQASNRFVVAYVLPVISCYRLSEQKKRYGWNEPNNDREFQDSAIMLEASIHKNSARSPASGSKFDYEMVALVHLHVESCSAGTNRSALLERLGWRVEVVREPIHINNVKDSFLRKHAPQSVDARVGMREMIRLYAFKMIDYQITVLIEPTTWLLRPLDGIFDAMLNGVREHPWVKSHEKSIVRDTFYPNGTILSDRNLPENVDIMFSRDYSSLSHKSWTTGISLAFVVIKPSLRLYNRLLATYQKTSYNPDHGWDSKGYAHYAGSMQSKGLLTYYFSEVEPNRKIELHRCIFNNLADMPFIADKTGSKDTCRDVKEHQILPDGSAMPCTDCRRQLYEEIVVANFALCQAPWVCPYMKIVAIPLLRPTFEMCRRFHESWFRLRKRVEENILSPSEQVKANGMFQPELFHGYCIPGMGGGGAYVNMARSINLSNGFGKTPL